MGSSSVLGVGASLPAISSQLEMPCFVLNGDGAAICGESSNLCVDIVDAGAVPSPCPHLPAEALAMEASTSLNLVCCGCATLLPVGFWPSGSTELAVCNCRVGDICRDTFALTRGDVCAACAMVCIAIQGSVRCCDMMPCSSADGILGDIVPVAGDLHGCCCSRCRPWEGKKGLSAPPPLAVGGMKKCCAGSDAPRTDRSLLCAGVVQLSCTASFAILGVNNCRSLRPSLSGLAAAELDEHPCGSFIGGEGVLKPPVSDQPSAPPRSCL